MPKNGERWLEIVAQIKRSHNTAENSCRPSRWYCHTLVVRISYCSSQCHAVWLELSSCRCARYILASLAEKHCWAK